MKKILVTLILITQFLFTANAKTDEDYSKTPYVGTEINEAVNGSIPFVLVLANPHDRMSIIRYIPIGKMVYTTFKDKYDFCILNVNSEENKEYIEFLNPPEIPAVYIVNPKTNICSHVSKKYHNSRDMKRILNQIIEEE